ncbi:MAG: Ig-like domain-containing protein [Desulfobacterales bacterium]|nr:Ig-like domain-containing protein [Desulfobacterales bacterium]
MKINLTKILSVIMRKYFLYLPVLIFFIMIGISNAALSEKDLLTEGDGLITLDSDTGLEWLDLTATDGISYGTIIAGYKGYLTSHGFRYATIDEVKILYTNAGILHVGTWSEEEVPAAYLLQNLMGVTQIYPDNRHAVGWLANTWYSYRYYGDVGLYTNMTNAVATYNKTTSITPTDESPASYLVREYRDTVLPTISFTYPNNDANDVSIETTISATFSEPIDPLTINANTFIISDGVSNISGTIGYDNLTAAFTPNSNLAYGTTYVATLKSGIKDTSGNPLLNDYMWTFTTSSDDEPEGRIIYVGDLYGNVGIYNTYNNTTQPLGSLDGYNIIDMVGLAYDAISDSVLLLNRGLFGTNAAAVFSMDAKSGEVKQLFTTSKGFQGGAVKGDMLYGINNLTSKIEAYSLPTGNPVNLPNSGSVSQPSQGVGIDPVTKQLYISMYFEGIQLGIYKLNDDGSIGELITSTHYGNIRDIDYYDGNFLMCHNNMDLSLLEGTSGVHYEESVLTQSQLTEMGLQNYVTGVSIRSYKELDEGLTINASGSIGGSIGGIKIYAFTDSGNYTGKYITTNENGIGAFAINAFQDGNYKFRADYKGYQFWSSTITIPVTSNVNINIEEERLNINVLAHSESIENIKVFLFTENGSYLGEYAVTDENGNVSFVLPIGKNYKFRADIFGNQYWSDVVTIQSGGVNNIVVNAGGGILTFNLNASEGVTLSGIKTYLFNTAGTYLGITKTTDENGIVNYSVPNGNYKVRVDYMGYQFFSDEISVSDNTTFQMSLRRQSIEVTVQNTYQTTTTPKEGIKVYLFTESGAYLNQYKVTDSNGKVIFNLPERSYKVRADYLGKQIFSDPFTWQNVTINIPTAIAEVSVTMNGSPLDGVSVYAYALGGTYLNLTGTTDVNGKVTFNLPSDTYKFRGDYQGNQYWSNEVLIISGQINPVGISAGGGTLNVTVNSGSESPMQAIKTYLFSASGSYLNQTKTTDANGAVQYNLADGSYKIRADYMGYQFWSAEINVSSNMDIQIIIPHQTVDITVQQVYQSNIQSLSGIKVYLFTPSGSYLGVNKTTNESGIVSFILPNKDYKVRADYLSGQYWSSVFNWENQTINISSAMAQITVIKNSLGLYGSKVYVFSAAGTYLGINGTTDNSGKVNFQLPAGDYKFRADFNSVQYWSDLTTLIANGTVLINISTDGTAIDPNDIDDDGDGYTENQGDCNDQDASIHPGAIEIYGDGIDQNCDGIDFEIGPLVDTDNDGVIDQWDNCPNTPPNSLVDRHGCPGICVPIIPPEDLDNDGDGYTENQGDCNDNDASINPGAIDYCGDGIDQDCDGSDAVCDLTSDLVAYYPFNGNANDESGNENNGSVFAVKTTDMFGNPDSAYAFNGENQYIEISDHTSLRGMYEITLSAWIQPETGSYGQTIINKNASLAQNAYNLACDFRDNTIAGYIQSSSSGAFKQKSDINTLQLNTWQQVIFTWKGENPNVAQIYINGVKVGSTFSGSPQPRVSTSQSSVYIGSFHNNDWFRGKIDNVRIYRRALTEAEVNALYEMEKVNPT